MKITHVFRLVRAVGRRPRRSVVSLGVLAAAGLTAATALGAAPTPRDGRDDEMRHLLARNIARVALMDLRAAEPTEMDYEVAAALLGFAQDLAPWDEDIVRKRLVAAYNAGDDRLMLQLTSRLLEPDMSPGDTVALLRLITASISRDNHTAESRLSAYERFLGRREFAPEIRSRLALDMALLLRERGDEAGFRQRLTQSLELDSTHKEAAALMAALVADSGKGPAATLEALSVLLMADPVDPNVHLAMARELAAHRVFESALRFHRNALIILQAAGHVPDHVRAEQGILQWHVNGPAAVAETIKRELLLAQNAAARALRMHREAGWPAQHLQRPEDVRLPMHITALAAIAAAAGGETDVAQGLVQDMNQQALRLMEQIESAVRRGELQPEGAQETIKAVALQLHTVRLLTGIQFETTRREMEEQGEGMRAAIPPENMRLLEGWLALRLDDPARALERLEPLADEPLAAMGIALAHEQAGDDQRAIAQYRRLVRRVPLELAGAWARTRLAALGHEEDPRQTAALERIARGVPQWVDRLVTSPREFVQLTAQAVETSPNALAANRIRITIRNIAPIPLALGSDRAINSRLLLAPKLELDGENAGRMVEPEVVDLDRRLRLLPREAIDVEVWADPGPTGWLTDVLANRTLRMRWRVIQGFVPQRTGGFGPGPLSQVSETAAIVRRPLPEATIGPELLAQRIAGDPERTLIGHAGAVRARLLQPFIVQQEEDVEVVGPGQLRLRLEQIERVTPAIEALAERYPRLNPVTRATLAVLVPHGRLSPLARPFDQVVRADNDPLVMAVALVTRVNDPEDEYLTRAAESGDERLRTIAAGVAERLKREPNAPFLARLNVGNPEARRALDGGEAR